MQSSGNHLESRVILQSFDFRTLHAMKTLDPAIRLSALFGQAKYDVMMGITDSDKSFVHIAKISGADILSPDESLVTVAQVAAAHAAGLQVAPYTVNTVSAGRRWPMHMWTIITDDPAALAAVAPYAGTTATPLATDSLESSTSELGYDHSD